MRVGVADSVGASADHGGVGCGTGEVLVTVGVVVTELHNACSHGRRGTATNARGGG